MEFLFCLFLLLFGVLSFDTILFQISFLRWVAIVSIRNIFKLIFTSPACLVQVLSYFFVHYSFCTLQSSLLLFYVSFFLAISLHFYYMQQYIHPPLCCRLKICTDFPPYHSIVLGLNILTRWLFHFSKSLVSYVLHYVHFWEENYDQCHRRCDLSTKCFCLNISFF